MKHASFIALALLISSAAVAQPVPTPVDEPPPAHSDQPDTATPTFETPTAPIPLTSTPSPKQAEQAPDDARALDPPPIARTVAAAGGGLIVRTADGSATLRIGGYMQFDGRFFVDDATDPHIDQFLFRSIRPELLGTMFGNFDLRILPDFAGGKTVIQDAYLDVHYSELVKLRFGKFKAPFGLERLQRDTQTTFTERGLPSLLTPNRDVGIEAFGELAGGMIEYSVGVFDADPDNGSVDGDVNDHKTGIARVFVHPMPGLGFGAAQTYGWEHGTIAAPLVPSVVTPGGTTFFAFGAGNTSLADTVVSSGRHTRETAGGYFYRGPAGVLAEYVRSAQHVALAGSDDLATFEAWQLVAQWVITGDRASYASVAPAHPFDGRGHVGAFDIAARYGEWNVDASVFDLGFADPKKSAQHARSLGIGVDWFLNNVVRFVLDVEHTSYTLGGPSGDRPPETSIIGRAQASF